MISYISKAPTATALYFLLPPSFYLAILMYPTIINFCPTGMVPTKAMNPHVPVSVNEIIEQVHEAYELGITIAHLHARDRNERPTWEPEVYRDILEGVRANCPDLLVCLSTSGRSHPEFEKRSAVIELGPDMCSLTLSSLNFAQNGVMNSPDMIQRLASKMEENGVVPELECFDLGMINYGQYLIKKGIVKGPHYWNLLFGNIAGMQLTEPHISAALSSISSDDENFIVFGGLGQVSQRANMFGLESGFGIRVGLEDNIWIDNERTTHATNIQLLRQMHLTMQKLGRPLMRAKELGKRGFYNANQFSRLQP